jgi:hypothetical protein
VKSNSQIVILPLKLIGRSSPNSVYSIENIAQEILHYVIENVALKILHYVIENIA